MGDAVELARYQLPNEYCGRLDYFVQAAIVAGQPVLFETPEFEWAVLCNEQPRSPYLPTTLLLNPWGSTPIPVHLRLEEGCLIRLVVRRIQPPPAGRSRARSAVTRLGGRIHGRYWYSRRFGHHQEHDGLT